MIKSDDLKLEMNSLKSEKNEMIDKRVKNEYEIKRLNENIEKAKYSNQVKKDQMKRMDKIAFGEHFSSV